VTVSVERPRLLLPGLLPADPALELDYLAIVDPDTFEEAGQDYAGPARLLVAARVGTTRLIDNTPLSLECHAADD